MDQLEFDLDDGIGDLFGQSQSRTKERMENEQRAIISIDNNDVGIQFSGEFSSCGVVDLRGTSERRDGGENKGDLGGVGREKGGVENMEEIDWGEFLNIGRKKVKSEQYPTNNKSRHPSNQRETTDTENLGFDQSPSWNKGVILGQAGTGKSTLLRNRITENRRYGLLCATTGIAALNLSTEDNPISTINSTLNFFNTEDLTESYGRGRLHECLLRISEKYDNLIPDEMSMQPGSQFTIINRGLDEVNRYKTVQDRGGLGLIMVGDFLQLPPVKDKFIFEMPEWGEYEEEGRIERLTKIHRQTDQGFLEALQAARGGDGRVCANLLYSHPDVTFVTSPDYYFAGTTIYATNLEVDRHNKVMLDSLYGTGKTPVKLQSYRWGKKNRDWDVIPSELEICDGAYVMILNNYKSGPDGELVAANGSKGWVRDVNGIEVTVELEEQRYGVSEMTITPIKRKTFERYKESIHGPIRGKLTKGEWKGQVANGERDEPTYQVYLKELTAAEAEPNRPYYDYEKDMMVVGEIRFIPLRLAWATTVHKCVKKGTIVKRPLGYIAIENINPGDEIYDGAGRFVKVLAKEWTVKHEVVIETYRGYRISVSPEHRFPTKRGLVTAEELISHEDYLQLASTPQSWEPEEEGWDTDFAWMLGALVGDGSYANGNQVHFSPTNRYLQDKVKNIVEFNSGVKVGYRSDGRGIYWENAEVRRKLTECGLQHVTTREKKIPICIWKGSMNDQAAFLRGLWDTDGSVGRSNLIFCSVNPAIARGVHLLMLHLGVVSMLRRFDSKVPYYQVRVTAQHLDQFSKMIGFSKPDKKLALEKCKPNRVIGWFDGWDQVTKVDMTDKPVEMYDLEIDSENHLFAANGIVTHNSQGLTLTNCQIDFIGSGRSTFLWNTCGGLAYVALSRVRDPKNLRIVGSIKDVEGKTNISRKVMKWI